MRALVFIITACAAVAFIVTLLRGAVYAPDDQTDNNVAPPASTRISVATTSAVAGVPERIRIPAIGVDASLEHVGLGKTGNMAVPLQYADAGWYRYGPPAGAMGSAVIDGHVDSGLGIPAVFARLSELRAGDDIYIDTNRGESIRFVVESEATYALADVPRGMLFNRADRARLNLITCEGTWIPDQKMYDERHVVYAVLSS